MRLIFLRMLAAAIVILMIGQAATAAEPSAATDAAERFFDEVAKRKSENGQEMVRRGQEVPPQTEDKEVPPQTTPQGPPPITPFGDDRTSRDQKETCERVTGTACIFDLCQEAVGTPPTPM